MLKLLEFVKTIKDRSCDFPHLEGWKSSSVPVNWYGPCLEELWDLIEEYATKVGKSYQDYWKGWAFPRWVWVHSLLTKNWGRL